MSDNSYWMEAVQPKSKYPSLSKNIKTDVVVIGGGITGITTSYLLYKSGKKVVLVDKGSLYSGETAYTTAFLTCYPDTKLESIKKIWNSEKVKLVLKSGEEAINIIEQISKEERIDCDFKRLPVFIFTQNASDIQSLKTETKLANEAGYKFEFKKDSDLPFQNLGYIKLPDQAKFHPLKYLSKLSDVIDKKGVEIYEDTLISNIEGNDDGVIVTDENGNTVTADYAVMATHITLGGPLLVQSELQPYMTYIICVELENTSHPRQARTGASAGKKLADNLYWDTEHPYNYIRVESNDNGKTVLLLGGGDHKTGEEIKNADEKYNQLERYLNENLPDVKYKILLKWSGQVIESTDGLPFIGFLPEKKNTLVATGFAGAGITFGTISARIITDLINKKENSLTSLYSLYRLKGVGNLMKKGSNIMEQYVKKYFGKFDKLDEGKLNPDSGKVFEENGKKVAVYKSADGKVLKLSAVCKHLGCIVNWNDDQKSWDCPCHGSRYTKEGDVIAGPTTKPLDKINS